MEKRLKEVACEMSFITNIQSVAKYESKILVRSWFFRIFTLLAVAFLGFFNFAMLLMEDSGGLWFEKSVASNIPYFSLLLLNTGQAVVAVFLSSEFLKRDKKLDTSEVFYVRPLSNAEYVVGKIWGNLRVFLLLNVLILGIVMALNFMAPGIAVDWQAYFIYFFLVSLPTLIFIIGLSIFLMLLLKNQALTFIILLGYIGLTLFYISDKFYYLFDYMAYNLPLFKSTIVGFSSPELMLNHRAIYLFAGLGFIFFTIFLFKRLPNARRSHYPWLFLSLCMFGVAGTAGFRHIRLILEEGEVRALYTSINNKYVHTPKMVIDCYDISVEQKPESIESVVTMKGAALAASDVFTFCLNPGLKVEEVREGEKALDFKRDKQILLVDFGRKIEEGDTVSLSVRYAGRIADNFCYLDIPAEVLQEPYEKELLKIDKKYSFQTPDYVLFTPETYWYPRPGTAYSDVSPDWQQTYFSRFRLDVKPLPGLVAVSQSGNAPYQSVSLIIGRYEQKSFESDSTLYSVWHIKGHDYYQAAFDSIRDTIPGLVRNLRDNLELYTVYDDSGVVTMYLTVSRGNDSENTNHSWAEINHYSVYDYEAMGVPRYQVAALLQVGDENGPVVGELGYDTLTPNATVQIRGQTSSENAQKNYKIKLKKNKGSWRGQRTIALNKYMGEGLRFRNKMAYDLIKGIDQMMGLQTQFVHLYVKDLTDSDNGVFEDYGLYTQVEQLNKTALKTHGADPNGQLYKINSFEFLRYEDIIRLSTDPAYDQTAFEARLEIKGDSDHSKLIEMLEVLNDETSSMEDELFATYFDKENIAYWMAFQLLTGNTDTQNRNVYLYSPQNSSKWYLWDWDNDGMLRRREREIIKFSDSESWERGVSNYWGNVLFRRCLQTQSYRDMLDAAMKELYAYMNEERIQSMLEHYRGVTETYVWQMPDRMYVPITHAEYEDVLKSIWPEIEENYNYYWESYRRPMPFYIGIPQAANGQLHLNWDPSYNFKVEDICYTVELAKDYLFNTVFFRQENLILPELTMDTLPAGQYFLRIRATNASGYTQDAFDYYVTEAGKHYGMICFYVQPDGSIVEDTYEE